MSITVPSQVNIRQHKEVLLENSPSIFNLLLPNILKNYKYFSLNQQSTYYRIYDAVSCHDRGTYSIMILDVESDFFLKDPNLATTLFLQELFSLCIRFGRSDLLDLQNFEVYENRIAFVMKQCVNLSHLKMNQQKQKTSTEIETMIKEIYSDITLINSEFGVSNLELTLDSIFELKGSNAFFISDWTSGVRTHFPLISEENDEKLSGTLKKVHCWINKNEKARRYVAPEQFDAKLNEIRTDTSVEIYTLALLALEFIGLNLADWEVLPMVTDNRNYSLILAMIVEKIASFKHQSSVGLLIKIMLTRDPQARLDARHFLQHIAATSPEKKALTKPSENANVSSELGTKSPKANADESEKTLIQKSKTKDFMAQELKSLSSLARRNTIQQPEPLDSSPANKTQANKSQVSKQKIEKMTELTDKFLFSEGISLYNLPSLSFPCLEGVTLRKFNIGELEAQILSGCKWKTLKSLDITGNNIGNRGVGYISAEGSWPNLQSLNLSSNNIDSKGMQPLAINSTWKQLRNLYLKNNLIGEEGAKYLAQNKSWVNLQQLDLADNTLLAEGAKYLAQNAVWLNLQALSLLRNGVDETAVKYIKENTRWGKQVSISY